MNIFSSITEVGLKRLYKFVLKRAIGRYINEELMIEQLEVSSREGYLIINDIDINCNAFNDDYLSDYSFQVSSYTIVLSINIIIIINATS